MGDAVVSTGVVGSRVVSVVVGARVVGARVVVTITEEQPTAGKVMSSQVTSLGWKQSEPSSLVYMPKQTGIVCQSLQ